jgi:pantoate--beta-alanine ligase
MGALHAGHLSLMRQARSDVETLVASIFVNPKQFGPKEDFARYPRQLEADARLCQEAGVDVLFAPEPAEMYPADYATQVSVGGGLTERLCGAYRPGHFDGVATVVTKLFLLTGAHRAYFGQKDLQQWRIIAQLAEDLNIPTEVVRCPTVREPDGLALSSRNVFLSPDERRAAVRLSRALGGVLTDFERVPLETAIARARSIIEQEPLIRLQYLEVVQLSDLSAATAFGPGLAALVAGYLGETRLIDNVLLDPHGPDAALVRPSVSEVTP